MAHLGINLAIQLQVEMSILRSNKQNKYSLTSNLEEPVAEAGKYVRWLR